MSAVRIRASAPDPFHGLRGHAYIHARGLTPRTTPGQTARVDDCQCAPCVQARMLPAVQAICRAQERRKFEQADQPHWADPDDESALDLLAAHTITGA